MTLSRKKQPMSIEVKQALTKNKLIDSYKGRPPYQQNDYLGWINRAKLQETKQKRLNQMIDELKKGNVYMKMKWNPRT